MFTCKYICIYTYIYTYIYQGWGSGFRIEGVVCRGWEDNLFGIRGYLFVTEGDGVGRFNGSKRERAGSCVVGRGARDERVSVERGLFSLSV